MYALRLNGDDTVAVAVAARCAALRSLSSGVGRLMCLCAYGKPFGCRVMAMAERNELIQHKSMAISHAAMGLRKE